MAAFDLIVSDITGIVVGEYGVARQIQIVDSGGLPANVSAYANSGSQILLRGPHGYPSKTYEPAFVSSGDSGEMSFTLASGDIDRAGEWEIQVKLATGSSQIYTKPATIEVKEVLA